MAKVRLDTGQVINFEGNPTQSQIENAIRQVSGKKELSTQATEKQFLKVPERLAGGFRREKDLTTVREQQRVERGLAPETPLEPVGFNLRNLMDLPADIADAIGPAFPIIGATIGGLTAGAAALPTGPGAIAAVAGGGAVGGAGGEFLRQRVGATLGFEQGTAIEQLGEIAKEGAFGAAQEVGGVFLGRALNATKKGILKAGNTLIKKFPASAEAFTRGFGSIATHMDKAKTQFALDSIKRGDNRVLSRLFADKDFADKFARKLFFGADNDLPKQLFKLSHRKAAKGAIKDLYQRFFPNITDDVFETLFKKGSQINKFNNPNVILKLGQNVNKGLDDLFTKTGKQLEAARLRLAESGKNLKVGSPISQINNSLADELSNVGFLIREGDGLFSINPSFAGLRTGSEQAKTFGQIVSRFFGSEGDDVLVRAAERGDKNALIKLANKTTQGRRKIFSVNNDINFGDFINKLRSFDVQISGNEFKALGKLSPQLAQYLKGLREIPIAVEAQLGGSEVKNLTRAFAEFADGASLLRQGSKVKNAGQIEKALQRFTKAEPGTVAFQETQELNKFLQQNLNINFLDDLRSFKAAQQVKEINRTFGDERVRRSIESLMKNAFTETSETPTVNILKTRTDPFLPKDLKIGELSEIHTVASALHRDAASLLRGRFLFNAGVAPLVGGGGGAIVGGPAGAAFGIGAGLALQQPGILRGLIKASANLSRQEVQGLAVKGVSPAIQQAVRNLPAGVRLLKSLLQQR